MLAERGTARELPGLRTDARAARRTDLMRPLTADVQLLSSTTVLASPPLDSHIGSRARPPSRPTPLPPASRLPAMAKAAAAAARDARRASSSAAAASASAVPDDGRACTAFIISHPTHQVRLCRRLSETASRVAVACPAG